MYMIRGLAHLVYDFASNIALLQTSGVFNIIQYLVKIHSKKPRNLHNYHALFDLSENKQNSLIRKRLIYQVINRKFQGLILKS